MTEEFFGHVRPEAGSWVEGTGIEWTLWAVCVVWAGGQRSTGLPFAW